MSQRRVIPSSFTDKGKRDIRWNWYTLTSAFISQYVTLLHVGLKGMFTCVIVH